MTVRGIGASATGTSHSAHGQPCQDAFEVVRNAGSIVACVCDGAGSAARSDEGARTLARMVTQALARDPRALLSSPDAGEQVAAAVQTARDALSAGGELAEFHATLCGVVLTPAGSLVFHLGDGVIFGINPDAWDDHPVSEPENGGEQALHATLGDPRSHRITSDDKTLVWLHREP